MFIKYKRNEYSYSDILSYLSQRGQIPYVVITRDLAILLIENHNSNNRDVRKPHVAEMRDTMRNGDWVDNGNSLRFDVHGNLIDAQHTLLAIIASGVPIVMSIETGLPCAAYQSYDIGKPKTISDFIKKAGGYHPAIIGKSVNLLKTFDENDQGKFWKQVAVNSGKGGTISSYKYYKSLPADDKQLLDECSILAKAFAKRGSRNTYNTTYIATLLFLYIKQGHSKTKIIKFFDELTSGESTHFAIQALNEQLVEAGKIKQAYLRTTKNGKDIYLTPIQKMRRYVTYLNLYLIGANVPLSSIPLQPLIIKQRDIKTIEGLQNQVRILLTSELEEINELTNSPIFINEVKDNSISTVGVLPN